MKFVDGSYFPLQKSFRCRVKNPHGFSEPVKFNLYLHRTISPPATRLTHHPFPISIQCVEFTTISDMRQARKQWRRDRSSRIKNLRISPCAHGLKSGIRRRIKSAIQLAFLGFPHGEEFGWLRDCSFDSTAGSCGDAESWRGYGLKVAGHKFIGLSP